MERQSKKQRQGDSEKGGIGRFFFFRGGGKEADRFFEFR